MSLNDNSEIVQNLIKRVSALEAAAAQQTPAPKPEPPTADANAGKTVRECVDALASYFREHVKMKDVGEETVVDMHNLIADVYNTLSEAATNDGEMEDAIESYRVDLAEADQRIGKLLESNKKLEAENAELKKKLESAAGNARLFKTETDSSRANYERLREELEKLRGIVLPHRNQIRFAARIGVPRVLERDTLHLLEGILGDVVSVMEA